MVSATTGKWRRFSICRLWFAWKFVPLWYQQQLSSFSARPLLSCDLLENSYLCGISNNESWCRHNTISLWFAWKFVPLWYQQQPLKRGEEIKRVVICLKIRTFVVSATTSGLMTSACSTLWFAWKFVPLWYQQQLYTNRDVSFYVVICLKIRTFVVSATTHFDGYSVECPLWFAWKFVPLWYQQQLNAYPGLSGLSCDLLENSYLCGISNNTFAKIVLLNLVVICLKIRTFVVSATTTSINVISACLLWFAWKFVPLWYQQQLLEKIS